MNGIWRWMLEHRGVSLPPDRSVSLEWHAPWPAWLMFIVLAAGLGWIVWLYRKQPGAGWRLWLLTGLRCAALLLLFAVISRPELVVHQSVRDPSVTAIVLDSSASMNRRDRYLNDAERAAVEDVVGNSADAGVVRADVVRDALAKQTDALKALLEHQEVAAFRGDGRAAPLPPADAPSETDALVAELAAVEPIGASTDLAAVLDQVLDELRGRQLAAVVLISDGRCTVPADFRAVIEAANRRDVPIHVVPIGSTTPQQDVSVARVDADDRIFVKDLVAISARVEAHGVDEPTPMVARLYQQGRDEPLDEQPVTLGGDTTTATVEFRARPRRAGRRRYVVRVEPLPAEVDLENNQADVFVEAIEDRLRVLFVDAYPRFEYRYLKNTLVREPTLITSVLLLSADEQFVQEGNEPIRRFPQTAEEMNAFDVILFGDVDPHGEWLGDAATELLLDFVGRRGGGVGFIAGTNSNPQSFVGTPLEALLPIEVAREGEAAAAFDSVRGFSPALTPTGQLHSVLRIEADPARLRETFNQLPNLYWAAPALGAAPGAETLLVHPTALTDDGPLPITVVGRYGAGRTLFQGTDDTWRWREYTGEAFYDAFWLHAIRYLAQSKLTGSDRQFAIETDATVYDYGDPVRVTLTVLDDDAAAALPSDLTARISDADGNAVARVTLSREPGRIGRPQWVGRVTPDAEGPLTATLDAPAADPSALLPESQFRVVRRSLEARMPTPDHALLAQVSARTGGKVIPVNALAELQNLIEDRSVELPDDLITPIWDSGWVLGGFILIIGVEWLIRKLNGLA